MLTKKDIHATAHGQITIPKEIRNKLGITPETKLKIYVEDDKIVVEPVSPLDLLFKDIEEEAKVKCYTEEELRREIDMVREKLMKEDYR